MRDGGEEATLAFCPLLGALECANAVSQLPEWGIVHSSGSHPHAQAIPPLASTSCAYARTCRRWRLGGRRDFSCGAVDRKKK